MDSYPLPAQTLVAAMAAAAAAEPERAAAFQGAPGANSHMALAEALPDSLALPCYSFEDALDAVKEGRAARAMIPIENSLHGRVADIHFLLPESGLRIAGEWFRPIRHCLLAVPGTRLDDVREAISHPQALGQCRHWLRAHGIRPIVHADTAAAAAEVADRRQPGLAAIAPEGAASLYGLELVAHGIEDAHDNITRFVILGRDEAMPDPGSPCMTTLMFEVKNVPAALYKALGGFATNAVNMTKLESYQEEASFNATKFYADIEGHPEEPAVARALDELGFHSKWVAMLGTYRRARDRGR